MRQLIVYAKLDGASGIFDSNASWREVGSEDWEKYGRDCITQDCQAVCDAAFSFGIEEILIFDAQAKGKNQFNIKAECLKGNVRLLNVTDELFYRKRIRSLAGEQPVGLITVGMHARNGETHAYFPKTIVSPPVSAFYLNEVHISEIGSAVLSFEHVPYIANIGCAASMREAAELVKTVVQIPVKDKLQKWEPKPEDTYTVIYNGVVTALNRAALAHSPSVKQPFDFMLELSDEYTFKTEKKSVWSGKFLNHVCKWSAPTIEVGMVFLNYAMERVFKK